MYLFWNFTLFFWKLYTICIWVNNFNNNFFFVRLWTIIFWKKKLGNLNYPLASRSKRYSFINVSYYSGLWRNWRTSNNFKYLLSSTPANQLSVSFKCYLWCYLCSLFHILLFRDKVCLSWCMIELFDTVGIYWQIAGVESEFLWSKKYWSLHKFVQFQFWNYTKLYWFQPNFYKENLPLRISLPSIAEYGKSRVWTAQKFSEHNRFLLGG